MAAFKLSAPPHLAQLYLRLNIVPPLFNLSVTTLETKYVFVLRVDFTYSIFLRCNSFNVNCTSGVGWIKQLFQGRKKKWTSQNTMYILDSIIHFQIHQCSYRYNFVHEIQVVSFCAVPKGSVMFTSVTVNVNFVNFTGIHGYICIIIDLNY